MTFWQFQKNLDTQLDQALDGAEIWVQGRIGSLPQGNQEYTSFLLETDARQAKLAGLPEVILARWYGEGQSLQPADVRRFKLRLTAPRGLVNFQGNDRERTLFTSGIGALATVLDVRSPEHEVRTFSVDRLRSGLRQEIRGVLPSGEARALVLSLLIADRSELSHDDWSLLRQTGTGHLLAISGLHIGLAAILGFWLTRLMLVPAGLRFGGAGRALTTCCLGGCLVATGYGALAGFPVSTMRALAMLGLATWALRSARFFTANQILLAALIFVLLIHPLAFLAPGFWLSFGAVLGLILMFSPRCFPVSRGRVPLRAQIAVMAVTMPLTAFWFQSGSVLALPSNLAAIPWVSFLIVPLLLASILALPFPELFGVLLKLASMSCLGLLEVLKTISGFGSGHVHITPDVTLPHMFLALGGGLMLLLPRGMPVRWIGLCILCTLFLPRATSLQDGEYSVETLDVGQGLAVMVHTRNHKLLYDTGPGDGANWSLAESVISPALFAKGEGQPHLIIVSHADLDHAGGLEDLLSRFPRTRVLFNRSADGHSINGCNQDVSWVWDHVRFEVIHPSAWLPYQGNDSSCVIRIDNGQHKTLLTGDISAVVENRLGPELEQFSFITVPHHGSTTSSSRPFLDVARPDWASVSAAHGNRFGFPRKEVLEQYRAVGATVFSTAQCGAIRIEFIHDEVPAITTARSKGFRPWRWNPEHHGCMVRPDSDMYHLQRPKLKE